MLFDVHTKINSCSRGISLTKFIEEIMKIVEGKDKSYDIFIEQPTTFIRQRRIIDPKYCKQDYINEMMCIANKNYKKQDNVRFHFMDIRKDPSYMDINKINNVFNNANSVMGYFCNRDVRYKQDFNEMKKKLCSDFIKIYNKLKPQYKKYLTKLC